jgi:glycosyltransferase involved in cell wall biosynthesis
MWLISHPDTVSDAEMRRYDHVFIASAPYAAEVARRLGPGVSPLLQCSDPALFRPDPAAPSLYRTLFVGNSRNVFRRVVKDAVEQGIDLAIVGTRWRQFISSKLIKGENIPNRDLGRHYNGARVVLNDHWPDMRDKGFVSNRIFDVLACGIPLVSDRVAGLPEDLRPFVIDFGDERPLGEAVRAALSEDKAARQRRITFAAEVHRNHSFDRRAAIIVETVRRLLDRDLSAEGPKPTEPRRGALSTL